MEARFNELEKRVLIHDNTLKKIGEQSQKILKASIDNFSVMISKLEQIQMEKNMIDIILTLEGVTTRHGKRTQASTRKLHQQAKELDDLKSVATSMVP